MEILLLLLNSTELSSSATSLDTASFAGKSQMTSCWRDFGFKRQRSALVGCTTNGVLRNLKLEHYQDFLISKREKTLISFISLHRKKRSVIHTIKLLWNNASVIIELPRSFFIHTACKLKKKRYLYKRCTEKKRDNRLNARGNTELYRNQINIPHPLDTAQSQHFGLSTRVFN